MITTTNISLQEAKNIGDALGVDWNIIDINQFRRGLEVELEHGLINNSTNVTSDDMLNTGRIALAHLNELSDYYTRLDMMELAQPNQITQNSFDTTKALNMALGFTIGAGVLLAYNKYFKK